MSFYKMVDDRVELARRLEALIEDNAETTARALAALFAARCGRSTGAGPPRSSASGDAPSAGPGRPAPGRRGTGRLALPEPTCLISEEIENVYHTVQVKIRIEIESKP